MIDLSDKIEQLENQIEDLDYRETAAELIAQISESDEANFNLLKSTMTYSPTNFGKRIRAANHQPFQSV